MVVKENLCFLLIKPYSPTLLLSLFSWFNINYNFCSSSCALLVRRTIPSSKRVKRRWLRKSPFMMIPFPSQFNFLICFPVRHWRVWEILCRMSYSSYIKMLRYKWSGEHDFVYVNGTVFKIDIFMPIMINEDATIHNRKITERGGPRRSNSTLVINK